MSSGLTVRELQICELIQEGLTDKGIAYRLGVSPWTVRTHLRRIFAKVGVSSRAALAAWTATRVATERPSPSSPVVVEPGYQGTGSRG